MYAGDRREFQHGFFDAQEMKDRMERWDGCTVLCTPSKNANMTQGRKTKVKNIQGCYHRIPGGW